MWILCFVKMMWIWTQYTAMKSMLNLNVPLVNKFVISNMIHWITDLNQLCLLFVLLLIYIYFIFYIHSQTLRVFNGNFKLHFFYEV